MPLSSTLGLQRGARGPDVHRLQSFLRRFGYLKDEQQHPHNIPHLDLDLPEATDQIFDEATEIALRNYQHFFSLPVTGVLDQATLNEMKKPRCGLADHPSARAVSQFVAHGNRWNHTDLTYRIINFTDDLTPAQIHGAIHEAFNLWRKVTPLTFTEVTTGNADILISFETGEHGDGNPFDDVGGVLAHAYYPPPNAGDLAGDVHFDDVETWTVNLPSPFGGRDLVTVAAHEIGHSLGLRHSSVRDSVMFASYSGPRRLLAEDDIEGIQSIYGAPPPSPPEPRPKNAIWLEPVLHMMMR